MPVGMFVMKWDDRRGTVIESKYPQEIELTDRTLMQIYSAHEYSGEPGVISLFVGPLNIMSYYSGPESCYYIVLLLNLDDDPDLFEGGLSDIARIILQNIETKTYVSLLPSLFRRISVFPTLSEEQQLAIMYQDQVKRTLIERLREEGVVSKSELVIWLKDVRKNEYIDIDSLLNDLIKIDIIKESSVKGMPSELIFLINDLTIARNPPTTILKNLEEKELPENLREDYRTSVKNYFKSYHPSEDDNLKLIELLIDPQVYIVLQFLRSMIGTRDMLEKLKKKGVDNVDDALNKLWENKLIQVFQDKNKTEYYTLQSDFHIKRIFPKYILQTIISEYDVKSKSEKVLIEYLKVLEDAYYTYKEQSKETKQKIEEET